VFRVNLAQIRSAVPEIFDTQPKNTRTDGAKNRTFRSSLRAVITQKVIALIAYTVTPKLTPTQTKLT